MKYLIWLEDGTTNSVGISRQYLIEFDPKPVSVKAPVTITVLCFIWMHIKSWFNYV